MKALLSWSGGKDSALAFAEVRRGRPDVEIVALWTTVGADRQRVSGHGVREELLRDQADALGMPLRILSLPAPTSAQGEGAGRPFLTSMEIYEKHMLASLCESREGIEGVIFGDLFLQDLRDYREGLVARAEIAPIFPLWGKNTRELFEFFISQGYRAVTAAIDPKKLGDEWAGLALDRRFLEDLPAGVDPCGENGEYHTFVHDGPIFRCGRLPIRRQGIPRTLSFSRIVASRRSFGLNRRVARSKSAWNGSLGDGMILRVGDSNQSRDDWFWNASGRRLSPRRWKNRRRDWRSRIDFERMPQNPQRPRSG